MKKKKWFIATTVVLLCIIAIASYVIHSKKTSTPSLQTVLVKRGDISEKAIAVGNIVPAHITLVNSAIGGIVLKIFHHEGDWVTKGTKLLEIKATPTPEALAKSVNTLQESIVSTKNAREIFVMNQKLWTLGLLAREKYEASKKAWEIAVLDQKLAQQTLDLMKKGSASIEGKVVQSTVVSPISGYILAKGVDVGDPVVPLNNSQSATALFTIANMHNLIFQGEVSQLDAAKLHVGMTAIIKVGAFPDKTIKGKLTQIALQNVQPANVKTASDDQQPFNVGYEIKITHLIILKDIKLLAGYSATADITTKTNKNVLLLPERALIFQDGNTYVELAKTHKRQKITLGIADGVNVEVKTGLKLGDKIIIDTSLQNSGKPSP